ncbi:MAG: protease complex subunit PrcB family protein [Bacteroidetes bacterium]|nr:protease complex subunit PrcB family protein [Bacteroidota bacterium]
MKAYFLLIISLFAIYLSAQKDISTDSLKWEILISGNQCLIEYAENKVHKTPEEFQTLWNRAFSKMDVPPDKPQVDFKRYHVAAIFLGWKNKGGYIIDIENIKPKKEEVVIYFLEKEPGSTCMSAAVVDFPFLLVKIPVGEIDNYSFSHKKLTYKCP